MVKGTENDERIEVIVEMYIELQAPPEQIVSGIDNDENIFRRTCFNKVGTDDCYEWIRVRKE